MENFVTTKRCELETFFLQTSDSHLHQINNKLKRSSLIIIQTIQSSSSFLNKQKLRAPVNVNNESLLCVDIIVVKHEICNKL